MNVVVDIGNARIKWAAVELGRLAAPGGASHLDSVARAFAALEAALPRAAGRVIASNVAGPELARGLTDVVRRRYGLAPEFLATTAEEHGVRCGYADPSRLGTDRWAAMIAAHRLVGGAVCVIDAGTAVTFDAVRADGRHLGGLIFAGARLSASVLGRETRNIAVAASEVAAVRGLDLLGKTTGSAVGHGAMLGPAAALDRAVRLVESELGVRPVVLLTGGDGPALRAWLETDVQLRADLVLEGLALFAG